MQRNAQAYSQGWKKLRFLNKFLKFFLRFFGLVSNEHRTQNYDSGKHLYTLSIT